MTEYRRDIARITSTFLGVEDHNMFTAWLHLDYGGAGQGAGGYELDGHAEAGKPRIGTARGMEFVMRAIRACGVRSWEEIRGRTIFALIKGEGSDRRVVGIENLPTEPGERFVFADVMTAEVSNA